MLSKAEGGVGCARSHNNKYERGNSKFIAWITLRETQQRDNFVSNNLVSPMFYRKLLELAETGS